MDTSQAPASPRELVLRLWRHPQVVGVVEYGSRRSDDPHADGDLDLMVIIDATDPGTGTLHGWAGSVAVDLGIVTLQRLSAIRGLVGWERVLLEGRVIRDADGRVAAALARLRRAEADQRGPGASEVAGDPLTAIAACERLTRIALEPVGGPWAEGEIIARDPRAGAPEADRVWRRLLDGQPLPAPGGGVAPGP